MAGTTLDDYTDRYAQRVRGMSASEIRALFAVANRPEVVSLAGGSPYVAALPLDAVGAMMGELGSTFGATTLQYGIGQGDPVLRERICEIMTLSGIDASVGASPDDVVVTVGGQQALDLVSRVFLDPGDVVLAEGPSYVGALGVFQAAQAAARESGDHMRGHQQRRIGGDRRRGEGRGPGGIGRRRIHREAGRRAVDVDQLAAGAPLEEGLRNPGLLLQRWIAGGAGALRRDRVEFPEDALSTGVWEIFEGVQSQIDQAS